MCIAREDPVYCRHDYLVGSPGHEDCPEETTEERVERLSLEW